MFGVEKKENIIEKRIHGFTSRKQCNEESIRNQVLKIMRDTKTNGHSKFEWIFKIADGSEIVVEVVLCTILLEGEEYFHANMRDITDRKKLEQKLQYSSYRDQLTGLYRRFFEEELRRLDTKRNLPLTLIMGDVNGLKITNDLFGHDMGDQLLKKVAFILKKQCRKDEIISRIGGDEFVIILPKTTSKEAAKIVERIKKHSKKEKLAGLEISISFGWATKNFEKEKMSRVLKRAEDLMYRKKVFESTSARSKNIKIFMKTLHEKNKREEEHSKRVASLSKKMANIQQMSSDEIKEMYSEGLLHDIGKIGISEKILNKKEKLNNDEWNEIKKHPEIGYRILKTVEEMADIAEYILAHHERWDGKGYPKGLKGEEIPLKARILALADAFDAMTSERTYKKRMSEHEAIEEIIRNAGTQFDPELAKLFCKMISSLSEK